MYNLRQLLGDQGACDQLLREVERHEPSRVLRSLKIKIISNCNLRCEMCSYWRMERQQLSKEVVGSVLEHAARLGCIKVHLSGGEVTLHHDLTTMIARGSELGMRMNLTSNGVLMSKERAREWISAGLRAACFSLDGVRSKTHDAIRGVPGAFRRTVRAVRTLVRESDRKRARLRVRINTVLSRKNLSELPALVRLAGELGAVDVLPMPIDGKRAPRPSVEQIETFNRETVPQVFELRQRYGMPVDALRLYPFGRTPQQIQMSSMGLYGLGHYEQNLCYAPYLHAFVSHTGDVFACCMTRDRIRPLGNVRQQTLDAIFQGPSYQQLRSDMRQSRMAICHHCDQYLGENRLVDLRLAPRGAPRLQLPLGERPR